MRLRHDQWDPPRWTLSFEDVLPRSRAIAGLLTAVPADPTWCHQQTLSAVGFSAAQLHLALVCVLKLSRRVHSVDRLVSFH